VKLKYNLKKKNIIDNTPLFYTCRSRNEALIKNLVKLGANINKENENDETPLHYACFNGNKAIVEYLMGNIEQIYNFKKIIIIIIKIKNYKSNNIIKIFYYTHKYS